jgi:hypothetical protein
MRGEERALMLNSDFREAPFEANPGEARFVEGCNSRTYENGLSQDIM